MRIGILTFHRSINNGAVMQCYSLSKRLKQEFPDDLVEVVDYHMPIVDKLVYDTSFKHYYDGSIKHKLAFILRLRKNITRIIQDRKRKRAFESAMRYLPLSKEMIYSNDINDLVNFINKNYDVIIAGSDAIWNYSVRGFPNPYYLNNHITCKMLSYAASCYGMVYEKMPESQRIVIKDILDSYYFLGTRDAESEAFVHFLGCSKAPIHTCDPTVFLDVDNLPVDAFRLKTKMKDRGFDFSKISIGVMGNEKMSKMIRAMFGDKYQLVALYNYNENCDVCLHDLNPFEWSYVFRYFKVTVTTFFHGTLLSLKNGVPVVSIALDTDYAKTHKTKVEDLLNRLDLSDMYWQTDYKQKNIEGIKSKIEEYVSSDLIDIIQMRLDNEALSFDRFLDVLKGLK